MRLKAAENPLARHNGNNDGDILNSPKRLNTGALQNSNYLTDSTTLTNAIRENDNTLNNVNVDEGRLQWCNLSLNQRRYNNNTDNHINLLNINNTLAASLESARRGKASSIYSESSPDDSLDFEDGQQLASSTETSPQDEEREGFDLSDTDTSDDGNDAVTNRPTLDRRGIVNPNYPGFQHLAHTLDYDYDEDDTDAVNNLNNNNVTAADDTIITTDDAAVYHIDAVNRLDSVENIQKVFYDKPVFDGCGNSHEATDVRLVLNVPPPDERCKDLEEIGRCAATTVEAAVAVVHERPLVLDDAQVVATTPAPNLDDAFLSNCKEPLPTLDYDSKGELEEIERQIKKIRTDTRMCKEEMTKDYGEKDEDSSLKEHTVKKRRDYSQQFGSLITFPRREFGGARNILNRRSVPLTKENKRNTSDVLDGFDVYNIETAMPKIDLEAIESHLKAAREEERRRRTDREEIRRRLAMGPDDDYYTDRPGRKPSLQARLQSGMNLQICFMNETVSDNESPNSDGEASPAIERRSRLDEQKATPEPPARPISLAIGQPLLQPVAEPMTETDFFTRQARLQTEARMALAQAKEMARMQMEIERQRQKKSPITEMVRHSLEKVGIPFPEEKRRLSRQILMEMNVAQLQVIVNDLHTQIETLNENLVKFLMNRDDLHMEQDSMLVDIEDLTRYLGAKEQVLKEQSLAPLQNNNIPPPSPAPSSPLTVLNNSMKPHLHRIASLVKK